jgi:hypothetical protein
MASNRLSVPKKLLFTAVVLFTLLAGLEIACRALGLGPRPEVADYIADWQTQWDSTFYVLTPSEFAPDVNDEGLRDRNHVVKRTPNTTRIVCLGDSVTFGYRLPWSESYPVVLEEILLKTKRRVEVFNVALPGWSTRQQQIAYEQIARKYKPDFVILGICLNDVPEMKNNLTGSPPTVRRFLYEHSYLARWLIRPQSHEIQRVQELFEYAHEPRIVEGWELLFQEVNSLNRTVRADGAQLVVLLFPFRLQVSPDAPSPIPQHLVREFCQQKEIPYVDGLDALQPLGSEGFVDYGHLSRVGAKAIAKLMVETDLLLAESPRE